MNRMDKDRAQVPDRMKNPPTAWRKRLSKVNLGSRTQKGSHAGEAKWTKLRLVALVNAVPVKFITHAHRRIFVEIITPIPQGMCDQDPRATPVAPNLDTEGRDAAERLNASIVESQCHLARQPAG